MMKERFYELDLARFIAAFTVVLYHYTFRGYAADDMTILGFKVLSSIFKYGYLGVEFFFMISGFVILLSVNNKTVREFFITRCIRIYPAFWIAATITSIFTVYIGGSRYDIDWITYLLNVTLIGGFFDVELVDGVYWTLLVEILFSGWFTHFF